jgi:hypothetical protein
MVCKYNERMQDMGDLSTWPINTGYLWVGFDFIMDMVRDMTQGGKNAVCFSF